MKILLVDNYDSFTFNLFHLLQNKVSEIEVVRNDKLDFTKVNKYDKIMKRIEDFDTQVEKL